MPENTGSIGTLYHRELSTSLPATPAPEGVVEVPNFLGGMVSGVPRDKIPLNTGSLVRNARFRDEWMGPRPGTSTIGGSPPNSAKILGIVTFMTEAQDIYICRITSSSFHVLNPAGTGWTSFSILDEDGNASSFPTNARFSYANSFDYMYIADGVNRIWEASFGHQIVQQIEDAPRARYIFNFADRIIAADIREFTGGPRPSKLRWPVDANPKDWTGLGSGSADLAQEDVGDHIAGLISIEGIGVIVRRTSIWGMTRQPFSQPVFRFRELLAGVGCDLPYTITKTLHGIIWADRRTRNVYLFSPSNGIQRLANTQNRVMFQDLSKLEFAEGRYDPFEREYHLGIVYNESDSIITRVWVFSFDTGTWQYDDSPEISTIGAVTLPRDSVSIDGLTGTIDAQVGTIDEYGDEGLFTPALFKGTTTGEIVKQSYDYVEDWNSESFFMEFVSQNLGSLSRRRSIKDLSIRALVPEDGVVTLEERNESGLWEMSKDIPLVGDPVNMNLRIPKKGVTGEDLFFRILTPAVGTRFYSYWVRILERGRQR